MHHRKAMGIDLGPFGNGLQNLRLLPLPGHIDCQLVIGASAGAIVSGGSQQTFGLIQVDAIAE